ncbi:Gfo/Idh/MocA family protein [Lacticaseibacillus jixiensis]|uniref:Gfo/Idh/MocA family protein n=1 Tax=Lacticaseibacillus jixiensis TaxID=3231926 RepID=UPI0036F24E06
MLNVAIIGTGKIAKQHLAAFQTFPKRCRVVALVNRTRAKAEALKVPDAVIYQDYHELLKAGGIDLVDICLPPKLHEAVAIACLQAGCDVLCEKPLALTVAACDAMIEAAQTANKILAVVSQKRYEDDIWRLHDVLATGLIGRPLHIQVDALSWRGHSYYDVPWRGTWASEGGGATLSQAIHHIDMLNWLMGKPQTVTAVATNANHDNAEVEDLSVAILQYASGAIATITSSTISHGQKRQIIIQGQHAMIAAPWQVIAEQSAPDGFPQPGGNSALVARLNASYQAVKPLTYHGFTAQIDDLLTAIETNGTPLITALDGRLAVAVVQKIYESARAKQTLDFE